MKYILLLLISLGFFFSPLFAQAKITQSYIQKELVIARFDVNNLYGEKYNEKIDSIFAEKIIQNDNSLFLELRENLTQYFTKRGNYKNLSKKEKLYKYLLIRAHYELDFRKR